MTAPQSDDKDDEVKRIESTVKERAQMFEWLRQTALSGGWDARLAAIAMQELNDYGELRRAPLPECGTRKPLPRFTIKDNGEPVERKDGEWCDAGDVAELESELAEERAGHEALRLLAQGWKEDAERAPVSTSGTRSERRGLTAPELAEQLRSIAVTELRNRLTAQEVLRDAADALSARQERK